MKHQTSDESVYLRFPPKVNRELNEYSMLFYVRPKTAIIPRSQISNCEGSFEEGWLVRVKRWLVERNVLTRFVDEGWVAADAPDRWTLTGE